MIELQVVVVLYKSSAQFFFCASQIIAIQVHVQKEQNAIEAIKRRLHTVAGPFSSNRCDG